MLTGGTLRALQLKHVGLRGLGVGVKRLPHEMLSGRRGGLNPKQQSLFLGTAKYLHEHLGLIRVFTQYNTHSVRLHGSQ